MPHARCGFEYTSGGSCGCACIMLPKSGEYLPPVGKNLYMSYFFCIFAAKSLILLFNFVKMKYFGTVTYFYESRGYGFISPRKRIPGKKELYFHVDICDSLCEGDEVIFDLYENEGKFRAFNVEKSYNICNNIEELIRDWNLYSHEEKACFRNIIFDRYDTDEIFRIKVQAIAKGEIIIDDADLRTMFSLMAENPYVKDFDFIDACKEIIEDVLSRKFENNDSINVQIPILDETASYDEAEKAVINFLEKEVIPIEYSHIDEDGYEHKRYKWDGSEEEYIDPKTYSTFSVLNNFCSKYFISYFHDSVSGTGNYEKDKELRNEVILHFYSQIKNGRKLRKQMHSNYSKHVERYISDHLHTLVKIKTESSKKTIYEALYQYFISNTNNAPCHGKIILQSLEKVLLNDNRRNCVPIPNGIHRKIYAQLIFFDTIARIIYETISKILKSKIYVVSDIYDYMKGKIERDGMLLSHDGTRLYEITNLKVEEITIPDTVTYIDDGAFECCDKLKMIRFLGCIEHIGNAIFEKYRKNINIVGDFSRVSFVGYNDSLVNFKINKEVKTLRDWSYIYNKENVDAVGIIAKKYHIEYEGGKEYAKRTHLLSETVI